MMQHHIIGHALARSLQTPKFVKLILVRGKSEDHLLASYFVNNMMMDPDCAICSSPANANCDCEAKGLDIAVRQAESKMMTSYFSDIRTWVRGHAQDYILNYYEVLTSRRKEAHRLHIDYITERAAYYKTRPHPSEIAAADAELKRGIDEDWRNSVQRYPGVLEYFYSLVTFTLPREDDIAVRDPPLSALSGARKPKRVPAVEDRRAPPPMRRPPTWNIPQPPQGYMYATGSAFSTNRA